MKQEWENFVFGNWNKEIDVSNFIKLNYQKYDGDHSFLKGPSERTVELLSKFNSYLRKEKANNGVYLMDTDIVTSLTSHQAGYLSKELELIVGLQTDEPLKRALHVNGGINMAVDSLNQYGYQINSDILFTFQNHRKTHNQGVFDVYTPQMRAARRNGIITGLPDMYGRGRIIGDYRRVPLYGVDYLIKEKEQVKESLIGDMTQQIIQEREEIAEQIKALEDLKKMANIYQIDISQPAQNAHQAVQFLYFAYLGAIKEQNGAAMSLGRVSTFLDIYIQRDLDNGIIDEMFAQELIDQLVLKLRMVRFARVHSYNELFTGDPVWITESLGGTSDEGNHFVTKTTYRFLHTLYNLNHAPEPNLTVLWSQNLPDNFKKYCAQVSIDTSSIQYENDDLMRPYYGDDYAISCCVSPMAIGKQMQFFGARANMAKALLYAINGGIDEISKELVAPNLEPIKGDILEYSEVYQKFDKALEWLANLYINTLNVIHYMHDKYSYERLQMALHDQQIRRNFATGLAGLSVVADSLSAIKYAKVEVIRDQDGLAIDYKIKGDYPKFGNNDSRVDDIAVDVLKNFFNKIKDKKTYRNSNPTLSILTITSNIVYGIKTGNTPDGRKIGTPFAPGANPMMGRDSSGALSSLLSVAKLPFEYAQDGISNTFNIIPQMLGNQRQIQTNNLVSILNGYFQEGGHHININVLEKEMLADAVNNPDKYPNLTIRVSGYAVKFNNLTMAQKLDVLNRTYHGKC